MNKGMQSLHKMNRFVSPPREDLTKLRQPLEPGEWQVFEFFDRNLDAGWEIYIQPHMNGLRPDFVLLHPKVGMAVFEVKNWDLDAMRYFFEKNESGYPSLKAINAEGKVFSLKRENPVDKVNRYRQELYELYCPRLEKKNRSALITAGVIFPSANGDRVRTLLAPSLEYHRADKWFQYNPVGGMDDLAANNLDKIFPEGKRKYSQLMTETLADDLRYWLREPDFAAAQRQPLQLDANQKRLATSRTQTGYRRIRGAAGSGKSLVLAARAAELASQGKSVLVVTYNITLLHYLMDVAVRWPRESGNTRKDVTWLNFHSWCRRACVEAGAEEEYKQLWEAGHHEAVLSESLPQLVSRLLDEDEHQRIQRYDAILVDEGQDFLPLWWNVLRRVGKEGSEYVLVADATQDIYQTAAAWTDEAMDGAGFRGLWAELPVSYRMPELALNKARDFATAFLPPESTNLPVRLQEAMDLEPCELRWVQVDEPSADAICCNEMLRFFQQQNAGNIAVADVTFLCSKKDFGYEVVKKIGQKGIRAVHTYDADDKESRRQKVGFYMGDARVKATTLHSFKGWEAKLLVIYIEAGISEKSQALIYTGLTRLKRSPDGSCLTVVCASPQLAAYGASWPDFSDLRSALVTG